MQGYVFSKTIKLEKEESTGYYNVYNTEDLEFIAEALEDDYSYVIKVEYDEGNVGGQDFTLIDSIIYNKVSNVKLIESISIKDIIK